MNISTKEYNKLRHYCIKHATRYGLSIQDCDDILHDSLLKALESEETVDLYKLIWKTIGKYRERRHREGKRQVPYQDNKERE